MDSSASKIPKIPKLTPAKADNKFLRKPIFVQSENRRPREPTKRKNEEIKVLSSNNYQKRAKVEEKSPNFGLAQKKTTSLTNASVNSKGGFSLANKKRVLLPQKSLNCVRESAPPAASFSTNSFKKAKRPQWDLKGRIQDLESLTAVLQQEREFAQQMISSLEKDKKTLDEDVQVKSVLSQEATARIKTLEKELQEKIEDSNSKIKEKDLKIQELQIQNEALTSENCILKTKISSLEPLVTNLTSTQTVIQAELSTVKNKCKEHEATIEQLKTTIKQLTAENTKLEEKVRDNETLRRQLHNTIQELKGNIRVFCRIRPPLSTEVNKSLPMSNINISPDCKSLDISHFSDAGSSGNVTKSKTNHEFSFDRVFDQKASQDDVFFEISQLVQSALDGYHVCIFAYGQTGSGKTYTMEGPEDLNDFTATSANVRLGMIPRAVHQIFRSAEDLQKKGWKYKIETAFLEIYNENIRDMLVDNSHNSAPKCEIKRTASKGNDCYISNVTTVAVTSANEVSNLLHKARANRAVAATNCNERSSRSHYIFQMKLIGENEFTDEKCEGILNLIDLAGSERVKESGSAGERFTEAKNINKSLSNLGNVIMSLSQKADHIPYRNSKLTHILMNSLGGHAKTLMFVNISPCQDHFNETVNSLRFATKVNQCTIGTAQKRYKN